MSEPANKKIRLENSISIDDVIDEILASVLDNEGPPVLDSQEDITDYQAVLDKLNEIMASKSNNVGPPASHSQEKNDEYQAGQPSASQSGMQQETAKAPSVSRQLKIVPPLQNPEQQAGSDLDCPLPFCQVTISDKHKMVIHMRLVHEGLHLFTCKSINCGFFSASEDERDEHELKEHRQHGNQSIAIETCQRCDSLAIGPMRVHIFDEHSKDNIIFFCYNHSESICFLTQREIDSHNLECKEKYAAITDVSKEIRDMRKRKWPCLVQNCNSGFSSYWGLQIHLSNHHKRWDIFTCTFANCGMVFGSEDGRLAHEEDRNEHRTTDKREPRRGTFCPFCNQLFFHRAYKCLYSHVQYYHMYGNIPFTCENHINRIFFLTQEDKDAHEQKCKQMYQAVTVTSRKLKHPKKPLKPKKP